VEELHLLTRAPRAACMAALTASGGAVDEAEAALILRGPYPALTEPPRGLDDETAAEGEEGAVGRAVALLRADAHHIAERAARGDGSPPRDFEEWQKVLGGRFGTTHPSLNAMIKAKHGAFGKFLTLHAHRVLPHTAANPAAALPDPVAFALGTDPAKEAVANPVLSSGAGGKHRGGEPRGGEGEGVPLLRLLCQSYGADARGWPQTREAVQALSSSGVSKALYALSQRSTVVVKGNWLFWDEGRVAAELGLGKLELGLGKPRPESAAREAAAREAAAREGGAAACRRPHNFPRGRSCARLRQAAPLRTACAWRECRRAAPARHTRTALGRGLALSGRSTTSFTRRAR